MVHGDADTTVGLDIHSKPLEERLPHANLTVLPGIGHMPHHVREGEVVAAVKRAWQRVQTAR
jgi:pimeloyl-ACP methyl ester carboxylesterase